MYHKDFNKWNTEKQYINGTDHHPYFSEREIWWCALGVNIGVEVDGKNGKFERPVLILKYLNKDMALVVPRTTKNKADKNHIQIQTVNITSYAKISQIKVISTKRLLRKISTLPEDEFLKVKQKFLAFFVYTSKTPFGVFSEAEAVNTRSIPKL
jgi:mRNA interferase MazF